MKISVIGLGKLGLCLAALHAQYTRVVGVDLSAETVKTVNDRESHISEPGVQALIRACGANLTATTDFSEVADTDMSLVIVPTPSDSTGAFTSEYVLDAVYRIAKAIRNRAERHTVVICSTVMPGECQEAILPVLVENSRKQLATDIGLVYSPEFIALGTVVADMRYPDMMMIGETDPLSGRLYEAQARKILFNHPPAYHMSLTSAEISKISVNAYVTMKISFANALAEICDKMPGADVMKITEAIGTDSRIGRKYLRPGVAFGGPCFPRDNRAFNLFGSKQGVPMALAEATDIINDRQLDVMIERIKTIGRPRVGILGLSYKPGTPITEEAFGMKLADYFANHGYEVAVYDPLVTGKTLLPESVIWKFNAGEVVDDNTTTVICSPDRAFDVFPQAFSDDGRRNGLVIDCWGTIPTGPWDDTHIYRPGISC